MATDSSHKVILGGNPVATLAHSVLTRSSSFLQVTSTTIISQAKFGQIETRIAELAALERLEKTQ